VEVARVTADAPINVRNAPATTSLVIGRLERGARVPVLAYNDDRTWVNVTLPDGQTGWVAAFLVTIEQIPADQVAPGSKPPRRSGERPAVAQQSTPFVMPPAQPTAAPALPTAVPAVTAGRAGAVVAQPLPAADARRDAITLGTLAAVLIIGAGNLLAIGRWLLKRERS
jgi:hypothetical protein